MKHFILSIPFLLISAIVFAQSKEMYGYWKYEQYDGAIASINKEDYRYLMPVQRFLFLKDTCYIETYRSEYRPNQLKEVKVNGTKKYELINFTYNINLKSYYDNISSDSMDRYVSRMEKAKLYISIDEGKLLLEIIENDRTEKFYFVPTQEY